MSAPHFAVLVLACSAMLAAAGAGAQTAAGASTTVAPAPPSGAPAPLSPSQPQLQLSADGAFVIDSRARLAWPRCAEGMQWNSGHCSGQPRLMSHAQAQALAVQRWKAQGAGWRLPRVPELRRLIDKSTQPPALNPLLFPNAPPGWHWTATANVNTSSVNPYAYGNVARGGQGESALSVVQGWAVDTGSAEASPDFGRGTLLLVRLVRPATAQELDLAPERPSAKEAGD